MFYLWTLLLCGLFIFDQVVCIDNQPLFQNYMQKIRLSSQKNGLNKLLSLKRSDWQGFSHVSYPSTQLVPCLPKSLAQERRKLKWLWAELPKDLAPENLSYAGDNGDTKGRQE